MGDKLFQQRLLEELFPGVTTNNVLLKQVKDEALLQAFVENHFKLGELTKNNRTGSLKGRPTKCEADEELKTKLKDAVKQYKKNKRKDDLGDESYFKAENYTKTDINTEINATQYDSVLQNSTIPIENLNSIISKTKVNCETESKDSVSSDILQLIDFFCLKNISEGERTEDKRYADYEKQGAIPKYLYKENSNRNASNGGKSNGSLSSNTKINRPKSQNLEVQLDHGYAKSNSNDKKISEAHSSENAAETIAKLPEKTCSKPFFNVVPQNPSPNILLPHGSHYVIPKHPDSSTKEKVVLHPETTDNYKINGSKNFEIKHSQANRDREIQNMNDLRKEIQSKTDSHLNIGPADVKLNEVLSNLEANYKYSKTYEKTLVNSHNGHNGVFPEGKKQAFQAAKGSKEVARVGPKESLTDSTHGKAQATVRQGPMPDLGKPQGAVRQGPMPDLGKPQGTVRQGPMPDLGKAQATVRQGPMPEFADINATSELNTAGNLDESCLQDFLASQRLEKKIEDQYSRMLSELPESNIEELRNLCRQFEGNEELVNRYIEDVRRDNRKRQHVLDMQFIFPDADPQYIQQEIEKLGGDDNAVNTLTLRMLDDKDYPKISENRVDAERLRLWKIYVQNFSVESYIRNVPDPKGFRGGNGNEKKYTELALEFLKSRYSQVSAENLKSWFFKYGKSLTKTCTSDPLWRTPAVRLAKSSFQNKDFDETFLKEVCYIDNKKEIDKYLAELKELRQIEVEEANLNNTFLLCPLCCNDELVTSDVVTCADGHLFCKDCVKRYVFVKVGEGVYKFSCPSNDCEAFFTHTTLEKLLPDTFLCNLVRKQQAAELNTAKVDGLESCPFCEFAYIPNPQDKIFKCQNQACLIESCRNCHEKNHIPLRCEEIERSQDVEARKKIEETMTEKLVRICPSCFKKFVKLDGCNKMVCTCGTIMCYFCRRKVQGYEHFGRGKCPLYSNNEALHRTEVVRAGVAERDRILRENPNVRISFDPTTI